MPELERAQQVRVAPGRRLGRVPELLERVGAELPGLGVDRIGEDDVAHRFGDEPILAPGEVLARAPGHGVGAAHVLDVLPPALDGRQWIQARRIRVVPAEVALVDGLEHIWAVGE